MNLELDNSVLNNIDDNNNNDYMKYNHLFSDIIDQIMSKTILIKFKDSLTHIINGKIIMFSEFIKLQCSNKKFNFRLELKKISLPDFLKVNDFFNIIDWKKDKYMFEIKQEELNGWYNTNIADMDKIIEICENLKINHINDFINARVKFNLQDDQVFTTAIDIKAKGSYTIGGFKPVEPHLAKSFNEAYPPKFSFDDVKLRLPVELNVIKVNAANNVAYKGKFNIILKDEYFSNLIDVLISDSFWFVVCFFRSKNEIEKRLLEDLKKKTDIILKRISRTYFNMFITLCDDNCAVKKDPVLNLFPDFISQCVYCALYLSYPKSRTAFDEQFKKRLISLFAYLYNGLNSQNTFSIDHWDLDLGTGNILETHDSNKQSK
jgi:hypothetical protein